MRSHDPHDNDHGGDARHGQDRGEQASVGADGDESRSVRGNADFAGNIGRRADAGQGGSHGLFGRGGEGSMGGIGGYGRASGRGMYDAERGEGWGGRPGGLHQGDDPEPGSGPRLFGAPEHVTGARGQSHPAGPPRASGPHAGRGPRGFRRSDALLSEELHERLTHHPELDAHDIDVHVQDGEVTLTGQVETRADKHLAEDIIAGVFGVLDVMNRLKVRHGRRGA